jgi:1-acyl-sn-glycerol-3-phosphate acyltransferase
MDTLHALENRGLRIEIEGMKNFQSFNTAAIFVSNHMSTLETMILPGIIQPVKPVCFVMKEELVNYPLFGAVSAARDPILVGRDNPREDLMKVIADGSERAQRGKSVVIFPQRTRRSKIDAASFNTLGVKLAKRNNVPVIPIAVVSDAWHNGTLVKDFGKIDPSKRVHISFGAPIYVKGNGAEEHQQVIDFIKSKFVSWNRADLIQE